MVTQLVPPRTNWDQGDFVEAVYFAALDRSQPGVLPTPACDIALEKTSFWTFVALFPDEEVAAQLNSKALDQLVKQKLPRYQWFPAVDGLLPAMVADFAIVSSVPVDEARPKRRIASMISSWREQLPARFVAYMGRVGTVDLPAGELKANVDRLANAKKIAGT
jgi:hypothetical protein